MKWILLVFLLISCTEEEDMRLFISSLNSQSAPTPPAVDETILFESTLESLPLNFTTGAGFSYVNNSLRGVGSNNSLTNNSHYTIGSYGAKQTMTVDFKLNDINSVFGLMKYTTVTNPPPSNSVCEVNLSTLKLRLLENPNYPSDNTTLKDENITIDINTNDSYSIEFRFDYINQNNVTFTLKNITKGTQNVLSWVQDVYANNSGVYRGWASIFVKDGSVDFNNFNHSSITPTIVDTLIIGDSYVDGGAIAKDSEDIDDYQYRWTIQIMKYLNNSCASQGWGGIWTTNSIPFFPNTLNPYSPKYVIVMLGLNNTGTTQLLDLYKTDMTDTIIPAIETTGAEPILCTLPPAPSFNQTNLQDINAWVKASGYRYIDLAKATTVDGDGVTIISSYVLSDNAHLNVAGNDAMYQEYLNTGL